MLDSYAQTPADAPTFTQRAALATDVSDQILTAFGQSLATQETQIVEPVAVVPNIREWIRTAFEQPQVDHSELETRLQRLPRDHVEFDKSFYELHKYPIAPIFIKLRTKENPDPKVYTTIYPIPDEAIERAVAQGRQLAVTIGRRHHGRLDTEQQQTNIDFIVPQHVFQEVEDGKRAILSTNGHGTAPLPQTDAIYMVRLKTTLDAGHDADLYKHTSVVQLVLAFDGTQTWAMDVSTNGTYPLRQEPEHPDNESLIQSSEFAHWSGPSYFKLRPGEMIPLDVGTIDDKGRLINEGTILCLGYPGDNQIQVVELPPEYTGGAARFGIVDGDAPQITDNQA